MWVSILKVKIGAFIVLSTLCVILAREFYLSVDVDVLIEDPSGASTSMQMSRREIERLDYFFRSLIINEPFAFTLIGSKPVSMSGFCNNCTILSPSNYRFVLGWQVFEKYKHHFIDDRIQYWTEPNPWVEGHTLIVLADREQMTRVVNESQQDFKYLAHGNIDHLLQVRPFFAKALQKHDALIGIILGFGRQNSWLYYEKLKDYFSWPLHQKLNNSRCLPSVWDGATIEKLARKLRFKSLLFQTCMIEDMFPPRFVGDPNSEESKQLKQKYSTDQEKLIAFYKNRNFVEATLSLYLYGAQMLN